MDGSTTTNEEHMVNRQVHRSHSCVFVATVVIMLHMNVVFVMQCVMLVNAQATLQGHGEKGGH